MITSKNELIHLEEAGNENKRYLSNFYTGKY